MNAVQSVQSALSDLPVSINGFLGDALQPSQWKDTLNKLEKLHSNNHQGPIMVPTKYAATKEQIDVISKHFPDIWLWWAITGLNETPLFSYQDYRHSYLSACEKMEKVVCAIRPIIPNKNDKFDVLLPILELVKEGRRLLTFAGYRDPMVVGSSKYVNESLFAQLYNYCQNNNIHAKEKCICLVSSIMNTPCAVHDDGHPQNIDLIRALGYKVEVNNGKLLINGHTNSPKITKGDLALIKIITKSQPKYEDHLKTEELSLILKNKTPLVCTSSWFSWARQIHCVVGCDYCFAGYDSQIRVKPEIFGCDPADLLKLI